MARFDEIDDDAPTGSVCNVCAPSDPAPFVNGSDGRVTMRSLKAMRLFNFDGQSNASFVLESAEASRFDVQCDSSLQVELFLTDGQGGGFHFTAEIWFCGRLGQLVQCGQSLPRRPCGQLQKRLCSRLSRQFHLVGLELFRDVGWRVGRVRDLCGFLVLLGSPARPAITSDSKWASGPSIRTKRMERAAGSSGMGSLL